MINRSADDQANTNSADLNGGAPLIVDNFDDPDGYYRVILGETLDSGRYHVHANLGKGMFSNVVRARDLRPDSAAAGETSNQSGAPAAAAAGQGEGAEKPVREVAIKIIRSQESMCVPSSYSAHACTVICMLCVPEADNVAFSLSSSRLRFEQSVHLVHRYRAGQKEANILRKLMEADPGDKKHIIRLERTFEHRGHLCLVFESLGCVDLPHLPFSAELMCFPV